MRLPAIAFALAVLTFAASAFAQPAASPWFGEDTETVEGHRVTLVNGNELLGLAEEAGGADVFLVLKTVKGPLRVPRSEISRVDAAQIPAAAVFTPEERYERRRQHITPASAMDHILFAEWCLRIGAYERAVQHVRQASGLTREETDEQLEVIRVRATLLISVAGAIDEKKEVRRLAARGSHEAALAKLTELRAEFVNQPAVLRALRLDDLERGIRGRAISPAHGGLMPRFKRLLDLLIREKLREKGLAWKEALRWAAAPGGLSKAFYDELAKELKLTEKDAERLWALRPLGDCLRFAYGSGTLFHPDSKARRDKHAGKVDLTTPDAWWAAASPGAKLRLLRAWFAEYSGLLEVAGLDAQLCQRCGSPGIMVTTDSVTGVDSRIECRDCLGVGYDRVVSCR